jgi:uncharacterized membrane protein
MGSFAALGTVIVGVGGFIALVATIVGLALLGGRGRRRPVETWSPRSSGWTQTAPA